MSESTFDMTGRVVIITGGAGLLGSQYARALSQAGARVVVADLDGEAAKKVSSSLDGQALALEVDVTSPDSVRRMISQSLEAFSRIDGLVNNAAVDPKFDPGNSSKHTYAFESYPLGLWNQSLAVNLTGMFLCAQAVAPILVAQKQGAIVNISSTYGLVGPDQRLYEREDEGAQRSYKPITYSVTKSAVLGFTRYLATYYAGTGIRVNTLTLGGVFNDHDEEFVRRYNWRTPLGRMARKDEYCGAMIFLLSDASSYMTGANLVVDGGWTAW
jgi:NAD(P)-dependent dehydrogenase (short-subunit alcohol dehydrogenase family)